MRLQEGSVWPSVPHATASAHEFVGVGADPSGHVGLCRCGWRSGVVQGGWAAGVAWQAHQQDHLPVVSVHGHGTYRVESDRMAVAVCLCGWRSEPAVTSGVAGALWDRHVEGLSQ
jgi:hypothetical protein